MTVSATYISDVALPDEGSALSPPPWAMRLLAGSNFFTLASVRVSDAVHLPATEFQRETLAAYTNIAQQIRDANAPFPVRFWNHLPIIHGPMDQGRDRYMVFNAARFEAFANWYGSPGQFERQIATASGVGHRGSDLVIHCLAAKTPGVGVENPRQIPPYKYSRRFGPRPPCFARATIVTPTDSARMVLVGGTASIRGEDSVHLNDLASQTRETLENLSSLIRKIHDDAQHPLQCFRELRVHHPNLQDRAALQSMIDPAFTGVRQIEYLQADLCRAELLVEIEGVAHLL